ncbi:SMC-Scp complex subunit ScpB [Spiroplasma tabanidicola]|uniref:Chromosome condensation and segregation factor B n=1 Tax=Spiroplasma tabanidicola TaxID=324079 RepID=A0A6I6C9V0_9MOLU|nr:SMC-Scp complex subunit ScpB [Spiroplasma tabanidicola]QGS51705.1 chromosome condensation and segregation factor B [Spiroplasma tabanidicola]
MNFKKQMAIVEGLFFVNGDEGTSIEDIKLILEINDEKKIVEVINALIEKYQKDDSCGLEIQNFAKTKYRMITKKENVEFYTKLSNIKTETKLSTASIETLSIIAYKGPITRAAVENIRGVNCDAIFYKLKTRNLITNVGKSDEVGKPSLYKVTDSFLKYFNLKSLDDLPKIEDESKNEKDIFGR